MKANKYEAQLSKLRAVKVSRSTLKSARWPISFEDYWCLILDVEPANHHKAWIEATVGRSDEKLYTVAGEHLEIRGPRDSAKSTYTALLAAWIIGTNPGVRLIYTSYSKPIALEQSRKIKRMICSAAYQSVFPWIRIGKRDNESDWEIDKNWAVLYPRPPEIKVQQTAELTATYTLYALGINGPVMGRRADVIISDDLVKSAESIANSEVRAKIQENVNGVLRPCLVPGGRWIDVGMLCRHNDIHLTYFLPENGFRILKTSAIAQTAEGEESYWPERHSTESLQEIRARSPRTFALQYQNDIPSVDASAGVCADWIRWTDTAQFDMYILAIDLASGESLKADSTSYCLTGVTTDKRICVISSRLLKRHGNLAILRDLVAYKADFSALTIAFENNAYQNSLKGDWDTFIRQDPAGKILQNTRIIPVASTKQIVERLESVTGLIENGFVTFLQNGEGTGRLVSHLLSDISGLDHDDDISAFALNLSIARRFLASGENWLF